MDYNTNSWLLLFVHSKNLVRKVKTSSKNQYLNEKRWLLIIFTITSFVHIDSCPRTLLMNCLVCRKIWINDSPLDLHNLNLTQKTDFFLYEHISYFTFSLLTIQYRNSFSILSALLIELVFRMIMLSVIDKNWK